MNVEMTFEQMAKKGKEILEKRIPITLEQAKAQVEKIKNASIAQLAELPALNWEAESSSLSGSTIAP